MCVSLMMHHAVPACCRRHESCCVGNGGLLVLCVVLLQRCSDEELLQLIHQGGLITRLKGCQSHAKPNRSRDSPDEAIDILTELWTKKAADVSKDIYKQIEGADAWMMCPHHDVTLQHAVHAGAPF